MQGCDVCIVCIVYNHIYRIYTTSMCIGIECTYLHIYMSMQVLFTRSVKTRRFESLSTQDFAQVCFW